MYSLHTLLKTDYTAFMRRKLTNAFGLVARFHNPNISTTIDGILRPLTADFVEQAPAFGQLFFSNLHCGSLSAHQHTRQ
jgi:hypothetical protein